MSVPTARFTATPDGHVEALMAGTEATRARVRLRYALYGLLAGALWAFFRVTSGIDSLYLALVAVLFLGLAALRPQIVRRQVARHVSGRLDAGRTVTVRVGDGWLTTETDGIGRTEQRLDTLYAVEPREGGILVQPFPNEYQWIPASAFETAADRAAFERALLAGAPLPDADL